MGENLQVMCKAKGVVLLCPNTGTWEFAWILHQNIPSPSSVCTHTHTAAGFKGGGRGGRSTRGLFNHEKTKRLPPSFAQVNKAGASYGWHSWHVCSGTVTFHRRPTDSLSKEVPKMPLSWDFLVPEYYFQYLAAVSGTTILQHRTEHATVWRKRLSPLHQSRFSNSTEIWFWFPPTFQEKSHLV